MRFYSMIKVMSNRYEHNSYRSDADDREHERRYSRDRSDYNERPHVQRTREYRSREQLPRDRYDAGRQRYERSASERRAYEQRSARDDYGQRQQQRSSTYRSREDHADYASQRT